MGASGHLFSPGSFGKRTHWQDGIAFAPCAFSKRTWREKVQRGALAHALACKQILIRVDPQKSAVKKIPGFVNLIQEHGLWPPYLELFQYPFAQRPVNLNSTVEPLPRWAECKLH